MNGEPEALEGSVLATEEPMDRDGRTRAGIEQHWEASERGDVDTEHAIYAADAILDYPQSGERFRGRSTIEAQRGGHPAERHFTVLADPGRRRPVGERVRHHLRRRAHVLGERHGVHRRACVTHETQYFADPFPAPPGRAALAEPIPPAEVTSPG